MAQQIVNIGIIENDRRGDTLRVAFNKINTNFTELYGSSVSLTANLPVSHPYKSSAP